ncbi:MAG: acetylornithine transaminase [Nitrospiraceae bacterium]|nr:acetylornithine transaminase [Nitrospiraceae bacterium]
MKLEEGAHPSPLSNAEWAARGSRVLVGNVRREELVFRKGRGAWLYDVEGRPYLDFLGGVAIHVLGHCHPRVTVSVQKQAQRLLHTSNLYYHEPQILLAEFLVGKTFADKVFFANSGTEVVEAAIKLVRRYGAKTGRYGIMGLEGSFHGRTLGALTLTGQKKIREGIGPLPEGFDWGPFNDFEGVVRKVTPETVAIFVEPVQGEGGVIPADPAFLRDLRRFTRERDILLVFDEIQTGIGRTGTLFAYESYDVVPDILLSAKALGGGLPLGALLTTTPLAEFLPPGSHGSTFGGNPLACAAGLAVLEALYEEGYLPEGGQRIAENLWDELISLKDLHPAWIREVRGRGMMIGLVLPGRAVEVKDRFLRERILVNATGPEVIRLLPPVNLSLEEIATFIQSADSIFSSLGKPGGS